MKTRNGFVSNSSSSSFIIKNKTNDKLTIVDFVKENPQIVKEFIKQFKFYKEKKYNQKEMLKSAKGYDITFKPHESKICIFGDEDGTVIGAVFDYMLRDGGSSKRFSWGFHEHLR